MKTSKLFSLTFVLILLATLTGAAGSAPLSGPCAPTAAYDPACDADHDGDVDIFDIQLTASHWNQSGPWTSDNDHTHLGQTWTGNNNPIKLTGAYGSPDWAPLVLSNTSGDGLNIPLVMYNGVNIGSAGSNGVWVTTTAGDGLHVGSAQANGVHVYTANTGVSVDSVADNGLYVGSAGNNGLYVSSAQVNGVVVGTAGGYGVYAHSTNGAYSGVYGMNTGGGNGVTGKSNGTVTSGVYGENTGGGYGVAGRVTTYSYYAAAIYGDGAGLNWAGLFDGSIKVNGSCVGCLIAWIGLNHGETTLQPGDVVAAAGMLSEPGNGGDAILAVEPATPGSRLVGVVAGRVDRAAPPGPGGRFGAPAVTTPAAPSDYVSIIIYGPVPVRTTADLHVGQRVTVDGEGVRPLRTVTVEGVSLAEATPTLGSTLSAAQDGLVWVLVNPQ